MEKPTKAKDHRDNLAEKINTIRSVDKESAQGFLEKQSKTQEYLDARYEKIEKHKMQSVEDAEAIEKIEKHKMQSVEDAETIEKIREGLGANEDNEQKGSPEAKIFEMFAQAEVAFKNEKEFGVEGVKASEKMREISEKIRVFLDKFKNDYLKESQRTGMTPEEFMYEFGIGSTNKEKGGWEGINLDKYDFEEIKADWQDPKGKTRDGKVRYDKSFSDIDITVYNKHDWKKESRRIFGEWKTEEVHEDWLSPKQEAYLYKTLTGINQANTSENSGVHEESGTVIPGVKLKRYSESSTMDKKGKGKPITKEMFNKSYGWRKRRSDIALTPEFIKSYLESLKS